MAPASDEVDGAEVALHVTGLFEIRETIDGPVLATIDATIYPAHLPPHVVRALPKILQKNIILMSKKEFEGTQS